MRRKNAMKDVYERLRDRLDDMATGYPATDSRVEIRLLKRLFTEEEAEFFILLPPLLKTPEDIAKMLEYDSEETSELMERMSKKGLLFRQRKGDKVRYAPVPYVVGIFEFQVGRVDRDIASDMEEYYEKALGRTLQSCKTPVMRTIPINRELVTGWPVAPYEDVLGFLEKQEVIALAPCICRTVTRLNDKGCDKPLETCFMFGSHAHFYVENGMGRYISKEEAREIIKHNEEAGLVMQPFNSQKFGGMCSCCGDCCGMLRSLKKQPVPAAAVQSNYFAEVDFEKCVGCETCLDRCQMEAIDVVDGIAMINLDRCIGCGLCVTTCSAEALRLTRKSEDHLYAPPQTGAETYIQIAIERGKTLTSN
jgi:NAD-dependent dihydropyrimidine dehydrogenase PreA subunit